MKQVQMLIGGESVAASSGIAFERRNPLDGSVASRAPAATVQDAQRAAAAAAFPAWSQTGPGERCALLQKAAAALEARTADFIEIMGQEAGALPPGSASTSIWRPGFCRRRRRSRRRWAAR